MSLSQALAPHLPFLRRYARALTGAQAHGDAYVRACLEAVVADPNVIPQDLPPRVALYRVFHVIWSTTQIPLPRPEQVLTGFEGEMEKRVLSLVPENRQALLLTAVEGFAVDDVATILACRPERVPALIESALQEIQRQEPVDVLIIEDEPVIALDLKTIVEEMGHTPRAVAQTRDEAVKAAHSSPPGLVLADIKLADGSSGIDAVKDILSEITAPVIFVTAYPERLLTGERPEPTFLVTKPFLPDTVKAAISQALFLSAGDEVDRPGPTLENRSAQR